MIATDFTARHRSMLRAIAEGRGQLQTHPHLTLAVDGLWCDFTATNDLISNTLIHPPSPPPGIPNLTALST